jgi:hypothetical protein
MYIKLMIGIALFLGGYFALRKKAPPSDDGIKDYTPNQLRARKASAIIKSALGVKSSSWSFTEDEDAVIDVLNDNYDIQNLIAIEYKKLTENVLMDDLSKYLSPQDLSEIKFNKI